MGCAKLTLVKISMTSINKTKSVKEIKPVVSHLYVTEYSLDLFKCSVAKGRRKKLMPAIVAGFSISLLTGCEAPLNLEGVEKELAKQVRRTDQLQGVVSNGQALVAVGGNGLVLRSELAAQPAWQRQTLDGNPALIDVVACPDNAFAALSMDRTVWRSSDNGVSWQRNELPTPENVLSISCAPDNALWVTGSFSTLLNSADGGASWTENSLNEDAMLTGIQFFDGQNAVVAGEFGMIARTSDGGQSWQLSDPIPNDFYPQGSYFKDADHGWVAGLSGAVLYTDDGGRNWQQQHTGTESPLYSFRAVDDELFLLGDHGTVLKLAGDRWQKVKTPKIPVYLRAAAPVGENQLLVAGGWGALFTVDTTATVTVASNSAD